MITKNHLRDDEISAKKSQNHLIFLKDIKLFKVSQH